jgi:protease-4
MKTHWSAVAWAIFLSVGLSVGRGGEPTAEKPAAKSEPKVEAKPEAKPQLKPEQKPEPKPEPKAEPKPEPKPEKKPEPKPPAKPEAKPADKKKATVVRLTIRGDYSEGPSQPGLFGDIQPTLAKVIQRMEDAAADKAVAAVWLRIEDLELGRGKVHELRAAIARMRKAGKPVYAELSSADAAQFLVAAACEQIFMPPSGTLLLPGVRAEMTFYKGLFDKIGLQFDVLQMGKFKGAGEPYTRSSMSGPLRESIEGIVEDVYDDLCGTIAKDRRLREYLVKLLVDQGLFTATKAQQAGLIDQVVYADQFEESLRAKLGVEKLDVNTAYKKKQVDTDFSGLTGLVKLMELFAGGKPSEKAGTKQRIAVVYAVGPIVEGKTVTDFFGESSVGSTSMIEALRKASGDPKVVAVVLRIDSPGGSATASDLIWRETVRIKKPLIVSMGDVAGSGGYYIAMGAKKIFAEPGTITGSIGVVGGKLVTRGLYEKLGLNTEVISRGRNSGSLSSTQPFSPDERKAWTELLEDTYDQFVTKAAEGRKIDKKRVEELAQGRVYTGRMAKRLGLIDEIGTLQDAIAEAKKAAGLKPDADVDLLILPSPKSLFEQLFGDSSMTSELDSALPEALKLLRQTQVWRRMLGDRVLLWMPYGVRVK